MWRLDGRALGTPKESLKPEEFRTGVAMQPSPAEEEEKEEQTKASSSGFRLLVGHVGKWKEGNIAPLPFP